MERLTYFENGKWRMDFNGWGGIASAKRALESLRDCIYEQAEDIPIECLWVAW